MSGTVIISAAVLLAATVTVTPRVTTYPVPEKRIPTEIVRHGKELWFVAWRLDPKVRDEWTGGAKLHAYWGRVTTRGRFRIQAAPPDHMPGLTARAPDGTLWLTDGAQPAFWRITREGRIEKVKTVRPTQTIAYGPDGNLWTTHSSSAWIGRYGLDGSDKGGFAVPDIVPPPMTSSLRKPGPYVSTIVAGPDGALWFTETYRRRIGRITTAGEITMFPTPHPMHDFSEILAGPDGALWYITSEKFLGRITTSGEISAVPIGFNAFHLASDSRGRIWYALGQQVGYLDKAGSAHEFVLPDARDVRDMAEGPDGAMWFADSNANTIGRIELP